MILGTAPHGEAIASTNFSRTKNKLRKPPPRLSNDGLQRTVSDISSELSKEDADEVKLTPMSEVEDAKCECCGMSEECTPEYIGKVRDKYCGKWICGLCSEAVKEEMDKNGGKRKEEALEAHMHACLRFNNFGRAYPVLYQAEAMREMLKKNGVLRANSMTTPRPPDHKIKGGIARTSSCIPAITRDINALNIN